MSDLDEYIFEKIKNTTKRFYFGDIPVNQDDDLPDGVNFKAILKTMEKSLPPHYFDGLKAINIVHLDEFDEREVNAVYRDSQFFITNKQDNAEDLLDDLVHESAHHIEERYTDFIYSDNKVKSEFLKKRAELEFELRSEGYWTKEYNFKNYRYNSDFDKFLYNRVGKNMLKRTTSGMFVRPYASVSLREYFATGFEAFYLGNKEKLDQVSPMLYDKINELHNLTRK